MQARQVLAQTVDRTTTIISATNQQSKNFHIRLDLLHNSGKPSLNVELSLSHALMITAHIIVHRLKPTLPTDTDSNLRQELAQTCQPALMSGIWFYKHGLYTHGSMWVLSSVFETVSELVNF